VGKEKELRKSSGEGVLMAKKLNFFPEHPGQKKKLEVEHLL